MSEYLLKQKDSRYMVFDGTFRRCHLICTYFPYSADDDYDQQVDTFQNMLATFECYLYLYS